MAGQYPYPPPPPPPSAVPSSGYPQYSGQTYSPAPRGGGNQGPGRVEYGSPYGGYQQGYNSHPAPYSQQPPSSYWQGSPQPHSSAPLPQSNYPPSYSQGYGSQQNAYPTSAYPSTSQRPTYPASYPTSATEYPPQQWAETSSPYPPYSNGSGRGGYRGDRGGHRPDYSNAFRLGFDRGNEQNPQASSGYGQPFPPAPPQSSYQPAPYQGYPPTTAPTYGGARHSYNQNRSRGRDSFHNNSRGRPGHNDRGDKFRHRGQRPHIDNDAAQKSDPSSAKKKKRKTNTLGLTPGNDDESDAGSIDEEKHLEELLGADVPVISDLVAWLAARRANYPTRARIEAKKAAEQAKRAEVGGDQKPVTKLDPDEEKAEKLRRQLAKVERKLEKRKREANDEGDEMRVDGDDSDSSDSEDEKPETLSTRKLPSFLPPPPITRADPSAHCKYYSTGGVCGKKGKCRFKHDPQVREAALREQAANGGRMTLKQRLLRGEKDQEDMAIIQSIVALREKGALPKGERTTSSNHLSLPNKPPSLPAKVESAPIKTESIPEHPASALPPPPTNGMKPE